MFLIIWIPADLSEYNTKIIIPNYEENYNANRTIQRGRGYNAHNIYIRAIIIYYYIILYSYQSYPKPEAYNTKTYVVYNNSTANSII